MLTRVTCLLLIVFITFINSIFDDIAIFPITVIFFIIGMVVILLIDREEIVESLDLYIIFFLIYLFYTSIIHYGLINVYNLKHIKSDELFFFNTSNHIATLLNNGYTFADLLKIIDYKDVIGSAYITGYIAMLADFFGKNSVLIQKMFSLFSASLIPVFIYKIGNFYFPKKISFNIAIVYGLFSFVPYLSSLLMRDIHIALVFIITFYIILQELSFKHLIILIFLSIASYFLREQTGLFMFSFTLIYVAILINKFVENIYIKIFIYLSLIAGFVEVVLHSPLMDIFNQIYHSSLMRQTESASGGSLGAKLRKLPLPLEILALFGYGQIQPFPPSWIFEEKNRGFFQLTYLIGGIAWFIGWGYLIYGIFVKNILVKIDFRLRFAFIFSILYLMLVSYIEFGVRRQMPVYPILFILMVYSYIEIDEDERTNIFVYMSFFYLSLVLIINYMKI